MALTPARYSRVDAELQRITQFLTDLSQEIELSASGTDKRGFSWTAAIQAGSAIAHLRDKLSDDQRQQRIRDELHRGRGKPAS